MINFDFLMGGPQGVQLPDPMRAFGNALTLAELSRRQRAGVEEDAAKSEMREAQKVAAQTFADAQTMGWQAAIQKAAQTNPQGAALALKLRKEDEGADAELEYKRSQTTKNRADAAKTSVDARVKAAQDIGNVAFQEAQAPNNLSLSRVQYVAKMHGITLPDMAEGDNLSAYLNGLAAQAIDAKDRLTNETTRRGQDMTRDSAREGHAVTMRGQDRAAADAAAGRSVTMRGQDIAAQSAKESATIAANAVSPAALQSLAQNEVTLAKIDKARQLLKDSPGSVGLKNYLPDAVRQRTDPAGVPVRAIIADIAGQKIHDRSGAAVTVGEAERLRPYVPNMTDDAATVEEKLKLFDAEYRQIQQELAQGKSLANVIRGRAGEASGAISGPAKPKLGEVRDGYKFVGGDPGNPKSWEKM